MFDYISELQYVQRVFLTNYETFANVVKQVCLQEYLIYIYIYDVVKN